MIIDSHKKILPVIRARISRRAAGICLLIASMAWLQLSIAEHQFDHALGETAEYCDTCAKFDRLDDVTPDAAPLAFAPYVAAKPAIPTASAVTPRRHTLATARGPPNF